MSDLLESALAWCLWCCVLGFGAGMAAGSGHVGFLVGLAGCCVVYGVARQFEKDAE